MMKKLVALLMALALLCTSIGTFAEEETVEEPVVAAAVETEEETEEEVGLEVSDDATSSDKDHKHSKDTTERTYTGKDCTDPSIYKYTCHCGYSWTEKVYEFGNGTGKHYIDVLDKDKDASSWKVDATCYQKGIIAHTYCSGCAKNVKWEETVEMTAHSFDPEQHKVVDATCTKKGSITDYCTVCKKTFVDEIPMKDHDKQPVNGYIPATCTTPGQTGTTQICTVCGKVFEDEQNLTTDPALDHVKEFKRILPTYFTLTPDTEDPTKTAEAELTPEGEDEINKDGVITIDAKKETVKGKEYVVYGKTTITYVPATCTTAGSITFKCEACAKEYKVELPALTHSTVEMVVNSETGEELKKDEEYDCVKGYSIVYKCTRPGCDYYYNQRMQKVAHEYTKYVKTLQQKEGDDELVEYDPSLGQVAPCIESWEVYQCKNKYCKATTMKRVEPTAKEHTPDPNGLYRETESTCVELGGVAFNCQYCFKPVYIEDKEYGEHKWDAKVTKAASCTVNGERVKTCSYCGKVEKEVIPAFGHDIDYDHPTEIKPANCVKGVKGTKGYVCKSCGFVEKTWTFEGHSDDGVEYVTNKPAKCEENGERSFYCPKCCKLVKEIIPATGHSYEYEGNDIVNGKRVGVEKVMADHNKLCNDDSLYNGCKPASCSAVAPHGTTHTLLCTVCSTPAKPKKLTWSETEIPEHTIMKNGAGVATNFTIDVAPTCSKPGSATFTCDVCKEAVKNYVLPALGHNKQPKYDAEKSAFVLTCQPLAVEYNNATLLDMMEKAGYKDEVAKLVASTMLSSAKTNYRGIGNCGWTEDIEVKTAKYKITVSGSDATIQLEDQKMTALAPAYLRVNWRYRLNNGDTVAFNYTFAPEKDGKTFFIDEPDCDGKLEMTYIEVVAVRTAHRLDLGDYATYGSKKL